MKALVLLSTALSTTLLTSTALAADDTGLEAFRNGLSLHAGMDYQILPTTAAIYGDYQAGAIHGGTSMHGIFNLGLGGRYGISGFMLGGEIGSAFIDGGDLMVIPGLSLGYAIPLSSSVAFLPQARAVFFVPTKGSGYGYTRDTVVQLGAELGLPIFGKAGFFEPLVTVGMVQTTGSGGSAEGYVGFGYRIGMVAF